MWQKEWNKRTRSWDKYTKRILFHQLCLNNLPCNYATLWKLEISPSFQSRVLISKPCSKFLELWKLLPRHTKNILKESWGEKYQRKIYTYMYFPGIKNFTYLLNCKYNDKMLLGTKDFWRSQINLICITLLIKFKFNKMIDSRWWVFIMINYANKAEFCDFLINNSD